MDSEINRDSNKGVYDRLLDVAEELFCERGYKGTSIRDIASSADCNVASVNYYFGSKDKLYFEVWRRHLIPMRDARIESINKIMLASKSNPSLDDLIKSFAGTFVGTMVDTHKTSCLSRLMAREYIDRHLPANIFVEDVIMPTMGAMSEALAKTCPGIDESKIALVIFSIVGQLVHLVHVKTMLEHGNGIPGEIIFEPGKVIEHIVKFSAAGIQAYIKEKAE